MFAFQTCMFCCISWIVHVSASVFLPFCIFVDVRRLSPMFAMFNCLSQGVGIDFRKYAFLHFCISALLHCGISAFLHSYFLSLCIWICQSPLESGQESLNEARSDESLAMFLAHVLIYYITRDVLIYYITRSHLLYNSRLKMHMHNA